MMNEWIISSSILIAAVLVGRRLLQGRISLRLQYALWLVVLVRLLVPVQIFTSDFGAGQIARDVDLSAPVRYAYTAARNENFAVDYEEAYRQVEREHPGETVAPEVLQKEAFDRVESRRALDLKQILYGVWFGGMAVMAMVLVGCNVNFLLRLRRSRREVEEVHCLLHVYETAAVPTPCLFGFLRPAIYLTPQAAEDDHIRGHVLAHELTHYRHGDHIWAMLRSVCLVLHWYNPLVWLAAKVSRSDAELACDEGAVLRIGEDQRSDYGRTLIGLSCTEKIATNFVAATTMTGSARSLATRLKLLMRRPRNTILAILCVVVVGTIVVGCTFAGAPDTTEPEESLPAETTQPPESTAPAADLEEEIRSLFGPDGSGWHLAALQCRFEMHYQIDTQTFFSAAVGDPTQTGTDQEMIRLTEEAMNEGLETALGLDLWLVTESFDFDPATGEYLIEDTVPSMLLPDIYAVHMASDTEAVMRYKMPDSNQLYIAELVNRDGWKIESNRQIIYMEDYPNARVLTADEVARVREAFAPYDNPLSAFLLGTYDDISKMSRSKFLTYYPAAEYVEEEDEFQLLKKKYPEDFENEKTIRDMNWPIHRIHADELEELMAKYTLVRWDDLPYDGWYHYLEETDCYYTYYSDVGLFGFPCTGGWVYDGGAVLYSNNTSLFLTEQDGTYYIQAHIPALVED